MADHSFSFLVNTSVDPIQDNMHETLTAAMLRRHTDKLLTVLML